MKEIVCALSLKKITRFLSSFLKAQCELLTSELQETKMRHETTSALLDQMTLDQDETLQKLGATRTEVERLKEELEKRQSSLDCAEKEKRELESEISSLRQNLAEQEEAQARAEKEREKHRKKEEEMEQRIRKIEQVLEEELEQFENLLKDKDDKVEYKDSLVRFHPNLTSAPLTVSFFQLAEEREKWEDEKQEKDKDFLQIKRLLEEQRRERKEEVMALLEKQRVLVEEATERLRACHRQEMKELEEKHQTEVRRTNLFTLTFREHERRTLH